MEFIIDYSNEKKENLTHSSESEESPKESIKNNIESVETFTESEATNTEQQKPKRKKTKKQLEALERARIKASESIKAKNQKFKELIKNEEKERTDIEYIQQKFNHYKNLLNSFNQEVEGRNTKYKQIERETRTLTQEDLMLMKMLNKY